MEETIQTKTIVVRKRRAICKKTFVKNNKKLIWFRNQLTPFPAINNQENAQMKHSFFVLNLVELLELSTMALMIQNLSNVLLWDFSGDIVIFNIRLTHNSLNNTSIKQENK